MKKSKKISLAILYFIAFVLPILGIKNCPGWNEGSMAVHSCIIDGNIFREYADLYYAFLLLSAFLMGIPVIIYVGIVIFLTILILKTTYKSEPVAPKAETSDVEQNKPFAIIGYIIPVLFFIPMLAEKKSPFGMFHAKQQLNLLLSGIAVQVVGGMIPTPGWLISFPTGSLVLIAFAIIGIINAAKGEMEQLPIIGGFQIIK
jgi:uncharacterized membrane protein